MNYKLNVPQAVPQGLLQTVSQDDLNLQIIDLIKQNNKFSTFEIATKLGVSDKTIKRHIKNIKCLRYVGSGYSGHWEINEK